MKDIVVKVVNGSHLTESQMIEVMETIMEGRGSDALIASFLTALRIKGETVDEITGGAKVMRAKAEKIDLGDIYAIDTCGTGGDGANTFNISTAVAFICAAADVPVVKHGNRAVSSKSGSADVLEALGVNIALTPEQVENEKAGIKEKISWGKMLRYPQTWSFFFGKFMTDGVWWFLLFWLPDYLKKQFHMTTQEVMWPTFIVFGIAIIGSVFGGSIPMFFMNKGMNAYKARMTSMFLIALCPVALLSTQYFGNVEHFGSAAMYIATGIICLAGAAHQAWSANLFTTVSDMFPKKAIASVTGIGGLAGGIGGVLIQLFAGFITDLYAANPTVAYGIMFGVCAFAYLIAWVIMKTLVPQYKIITDL